MNNCRPYSGLSLWRHPFRYAKNQCGLASVLSALWLVAGLFAGTVFAQISSDKLIVLHADGLTHTVQHTITTDNDLVVLNLPEGRTPLDTRFSGPAKLTYSTVFNNNPERISLQSGAVVSRYQHQYDLQVVSSQADGIHTLQYSTQHPGLIVEPASSVHMSSTWLLPDNATLLDFQATDAAGNEVGLWQTRGSALSYRAQSDATLSIRLRLQPLDALISETCESLTDDNDACKPDTDKDGVPDYRDICLSAESEGDVVNLFDDPDPTGCDHQPLVVLHDVNFQSGQSYLDAASRKALDRVAVALQRVPSRLYEVRSHTDNAGGRSHNQRLSENRADAVRHYLMLRGVSPNQLNARGYGESTPAHDNRQAAGRRANRRIELKRLN